MSCRCLIWFKSSGSRSVVDVPRSRKITMSRVKYHEASWTILKHRPEYQFTREGERELGKILHRSCRS